MHLISLPFGAILIMGALYLFYAFNRKRKAVREDRRERLNNIRQEYLDALMRSKLDKNSNENKM